MYSAQYWIMEEVAKLPQFELYIRRKTFWDCLTTDHAAEIKEFVDCLCKKYSQKKIKIKIEELWSPYSLVYFESREVIPNILPLGLLLGVNLDILDSYIGL